MGYYVNLSVIFQSRHNEGIAKLAKQYLIDAGYEMPKTEEFLPEHDYKKEYLFSTREAAWFLCDLAKRTGNNPGLKGGLSMWGIVGNHTMPEDFVDDLKGFWFDLLTGKIDGGPKDFEHIMVFYEREQSERAEAIEIYLDRKKNREYEINDLIIKYHEDLPFAWMQF